MNMFVKIFIASVACLTMVVAGAYIYLMHAPASAPPRLGGTLHRDSIQVGPLTRRYLAYVPARIAEHPALVLAFHGSKGDGQTMRVFTGFGFERLAERHGFIVVYPDGFEHHWNDCRKSGPYTANTLDIDDLGFVRALIGRLHDTHGVDLDRIFATGFSNGGHMAYRLALEMPETIRAVAAVGANLPTPDNLDCTPSGKPVAVMVFNGDADPINPFAGGTVSIYGFGDRDRVHSAESTAHYFRRLAGHDVAPVVRNSSDVMHRQWTTPDRPEISLYTVRGGGHTIPQSHFRFPRLLGPTSTTIDGPSEIWAFFARQLPDGGAGQHTESTTTLTR